jgi:hypothetical protein
LDVVFSFFEGYALFSLGVAKSIYHKPVEPRIKHHRIHTWLLTLLLDLTGSLFIFLWSIRIQLNISIRNRYKLITIFNLAGGYQLNMAEGHLLGSNLDRRGHMMLGTGLMELKQINHLGLFHEVLVGFHLHHVDIKGDVVKHGDTSGISLLRDYLELLLLLSTAALL